MKRVFILAVTLSLALSLSARLEGASEKPKHGGTLTVGVRGDLELTSPFINVRGTQGKILDLMFDTLLGMDLQGRIQPALAESWETSKDGRLYTFKLRKGVKFHNGREMTAEDVKFSMDYAMNPKNGAIGFLVLSVVGKVEVIDSYTLRVSTEKPSPAFLSLLTTNKTFPVVPKGALLEGIDKITTFPPGTGPFRFAEWKPGQRVVLDRYGNFWGRKAFVDRLILRPIRQDTVRFTAFRAGDVDMIQQVPLEWVKEIVDGKLKGIQYTAASHSQFLGGDFNVAQPPFNNKKLRQAVAHAIDRREILAAGHFGFGEATDQRYPRDHEWYIKDVAAPPLDLDRARALLKEAGYRGETIEFMVEPLQERQAVATALQAQLKKIGMNVKLDVIEGGAHRARERAGEFAFKFTGGGIKPDPIHIFSRFKCEPDVKKRASNMTGYCDPHMDKLLEKLETETNPDKRAAIFREIVVKIQEDVPEVNFGFVPTFYAFREYVRGFTTDSEANYYWWGGGLNHAWLDK